MAKIAPSVTRMWFKIDSRSTLNYLDTSLAASAVNRRFYRQGTTWAVAGMSLHTRGAAGTVTVSKIPDSWVAKNSHTKAKELWMKSQEQVLSLEPSLASRYRDFKIYLDSDMVGASFQDVTASAMDGEIMLPVDSGSSVAKVGEWIYSTIQLPNDGGSNPPTEITMHMMGADAGNSRGIIDGYAASRSRPQTHDPNIPSQISWMNEVFDVADLNEDIREDVTENNDVPPYRVGDANDPSAAQDLTFYPGGTNNMPQPAIHDRQGVTSTTVGGKTHINGGMFGCGLIKFKFAFTDTPVDDMYLCVDLVPGKYKGYLTEVY